MFHVQLKEYLFSDVIKQNNEEVILQIPYLVFDSYVVLSKQCSLDDIGLVNTQSFVQVGPAVRAQFKIFLLIQFGNESGPYKYFSNVPRQNRATLVEFDIETYKFCKTDIISWVFSKKIKKTTYLGPNLATLGKDLYICLLDPQVTKPQCVIYDLTNLQLPPKFGPITFQIHQFCTHTLLVGDDLTYDISNFKMNPCDQPIKKDIYCQIGTIRIDNSIKLLGNLIENHRFLDSTPIVSRVGYVQQQFVLTSQLLAQFFSRFESHLGREGKFLLRHQKMLSELVNCKNQNENDMLYYWFDFVQIDSPNSKIIKSLLQSYFSSNVVPVIAPIHCYINLENLLFVIAGGLINYVGTKQTQYLVYRDTVLFTFQHQLPNNFLFQNGPSYRIDDEWSVVIFVETDTLCGNVYIFNHYTLEFIKQRKTNAITIDREQNQGPFMCYYNRSLYCIVNDLIEKYDQNNGDYSNLEELFVPAGVVPQTNYNKALQLHMQNRTIVIVNLTAEDQIEYVIQNDESSNVKKLVNQQKQIFVGYGQIIYKDEQNSLTYINEIQQLHESLFRAQTEPLIFATRCNTHALDFTGIVRDTSFEKGLSQHFLQSLASLGSESQKLKLLLSEEKYKFLLEMNFQSFYEESKLAAVEEILSTYYLKEIDMIRIGMRKAQSVQHQIRDSQRYLGKLKHLEHHLSKSKQLQEFLVEQSIQKFQAMNELKRRMDELTDNVPVVQQEDFATSLMSFMTIISKDEDVVQ